MLAERSHAITGGTESLLGLLGSSALSAPGADIFLLRIELLEVVPGILQRPGSADAALVDRFQGASSPVDGVE
ncbi:hypothetical protein [Pseudomonas protegens]|uniref:hypothetical protein n=1 Tax=Pseudomonas protegens TaxID=380021 RepID=UPI0021AC6D56|nr:hypothetical protein [Pseudomonas protegens]